MRTRGVKHLDHVLDNGQIDWMIVSAKECPDEHTEQKIAACYFRVPHEPWGADRAFVLPVTVRRSQRRVIFYQRSGLERLSKTFSTPASAVAPTTNEQPRPESTIT